MGQDNERRNGAWPPIQRLRSSFNTPQGGDIDYTEDGSERKGSTGTLRATGLISHHLSELHWLADKEAMVVTRVPSRVGTWNSASN